MTLRQHADQIIHSAISRVMPDKAVKSALEKKAFGENIYLVAAGKAAWQMADAAYDVLGSSIKDGIVITKYHHSKGPIGTLRIFEAGHPIPDENSFLATEAAIELVTPLGEKDTVLFLLSGGGSALFEKPKISGGELADITQQLLACGADISEINTIRKRLSLVKGGRFAQLCAPAQVYAIVLSDIVGDPLDMIASGPVCPDSSTCEQAVSTAKHYGLRLSGQAEALLHVETPKILSNVEAVLTGSVRQLITGAAEAALALGYRPITLTASLCCEAKEAGSFLASIAQYHVDSKESLAFLAGGETVVHLTGGGLGGRNQELALSAAVGIDGMQSTAIFSFGSDGTDGPTDAAGGYVDGNTAKVLRKLGISIPEALQNNDAYPALKVCDGLIMTGPTGTNVNDVAVLLIKR